MWPFKKKPDPVLVEASDPRPHTMEVTLPGGAKVTHKAKGANTNDNFLVLYELKGTWSHTGDEETRNFAIYAPDTWIKVERKD